ncbi:MAG: Dabb family protein [Oscillospiraceae bacterium]
MVRHIVMWNFKEGFTPEENAANAKKIKAELEALTATIPGIVSLHVYIDPVGKSNRDIVLNSLFESEEALANYVDHPDHVRAGGFVHAATDNRACIDYVE